MLDTIKTYTFFKEKNIVDFRLLANQGMYNATYLLKTGDNSFIIKKFYKPLHVDKNLEHKIKQIAYKRGICPESIMLDTKNQIEINRYFEGCHKKFLNRSDLKRVAKTLSALHKIRLQGKAFNINRFFTKNSKKIDSKLKIALYELKKFKKELVLCHNDLNPKNILFSNTAKFIDWEFATTNDRYFDLACISVEFNLDKRDESYFVHSYFKNKNYNIRKLKTYKIIYKHICKIWFDIISKREGFKRCQEQF
ncbi:MAG: choline/ethanolamine kinase family protein [Sulfurospirillum sp.]